MSAIKRIDCKYNIAVVENIGLSEPVLLYPALLLARCNSTLSDVHNFEAKKRGFRWQLFVRSYFSTSELHSILLAILRFLLRLKLMTVAVKLLVIFFCSDT